MSSGTKREDSVTAGRLRWVSDGALSEGDPVVIRGNERARDGQPVRIR